MVLDIFKNGSFMSNALLDFENRRFQISRQRLGRLRRLKVFTNMNFIETIF